MKTSQEIEQLAFEEFGNYSMYATGAIFGYDLGLKDAEQVNPKWISCTPEHEIQKGYYAFLLKHTTSGIQGVRLLELNNIENTSEVFHYGTHYCRIELPDLPTT